MRLRELFTSIYASIIVLLIVLAITSIYKYYNYNKLVKSNVILYKSYVIAEELRRSSDDLTRYCRTYVQTGDSTWENKYWEVLNIRNGIQPRPDGRAISLQDSMKELGFTEVELAKLSEAEQNSNNLVWTEKVAFNAMKGLYADSLRNFTIKRKPDTAYARKIMFDEKYHYDKAIIMEPIDDCVNMVIQRTHSEVEKQTKHNIFLLYIIILLIVVISVISIISYFMIRNRIIFQMEELERAKKRAEQNEKKFRILFEKSPDYITITSYDGDFLDCNQATLNFQNLNSLQELKTFKSYDTFVNPEERDAFVKELDKYGFVRNKEVKFKSLNNDITSNGLVSSELMTMGKDNTVIISWIRDISEKSIIENKIRKLTTAITQNPAAIVITDVNGKIEYINPQFTIYSGYSQEEVTGKTPNVLKSGKHTKEFYKNLWTTISAGNVWKGEIFNKRKDKTFYWEEATIAPIFDKKQKITNYVAIKHDITDKKEAELDLIKHQNKLKELNATKDKLMSIIGHDLKGPVGNLKSFVEILLSENDLSNTKQVKQILLMMQSSVNRTFSLLENLLSWARSQQDSVTFIPEHINLYEIVEVSIFLLIEMARNKSIAIQNDIPPGIIVNIDKNMIMTVIRNLVSNAIKFTHANKKIYLSASTQGNLCTVSIKDEGVGISKESINKLFDRPGCLTTIGTSGESGTGLGLLLCREFVEKNGGEIWVESTEEKGSVFKFTIPIM